MVIPAPPAPPACEGADPTIFDQTDWQNTNIGISICERCPVRAWCLETVDPARGNFDGIAGGHVWIDGKIKWSIPGDEIATNYLERRNVDTVHHQRFDPNMIRRFAAGEVHRQQLNRSERLAAAREIYRNENVTIREVSERTGVPKTTLTRSLDIQPENTTAAYRTVKARIDATQQSIPPDRLDTTAINDFLAGQRKWWTLNTTERCVAAHQMVRTGTNPPSRAIERAHITRNEFDNTTTA
jgi:hypothetical protein